MRGGFFAVDRTAFVAACGLGLNPAAAYLVLARGSGGDNRTSRWSAEAAAKRLQIRWTTARAAIDALERAGLIEAQNRSTRPTYRLTNLESPIWLPNELVDGAGSEVPPVWRVRQGQDPMTLRLLVELYAEQNLREDGGVATRMLRRRFERERVGQRGPFVVWRFHTPTPSTEWDCPIASPHFVAVPKKGRQKAPNRLDPMPFFRRVETLEVLGLIEWVPYLVEGPEGEPIHPVAHDSTLECERLLADTCGRAAVACLTEGQADRALDRGGVLAPVLRHIERVELRGVVRLRYRPHTALTSAWWANHVERCEGFAARYSELIDQIEAGVEGVA